jgi:hypothetical protein
MFMGKKKLIPLFAMIVLLIGTCSTAYVYATQTDADGIIINGQQYTINQIFFIAEPRSFDSLEFSGIALDDLIKKAGVGCPSCHTYTIIAEDNYQKTVSWENLQGGLLTKEGMTVFPDLPKAFRVKNIVKIEVN